MSARPRMSRRLRLLGSAVAAAGVLLTAACGGGSASAKQAATPDASASAAGKGGGRAAFNDCLLKNGVTPPSRGAGGGSPQSQSPEMQKAVQACRSLLPRGGRFGQNPAALAAFRTCMSSHGVVLPARPSGAPGQGNGPSPDPGQSNAPGQGRMGGALRGLNTADPKVSAALKICSALLPTRAASPGPAAS